MTTDEQRAAFEVQLWELCEYVVDGGPCIDPECVPCEAVRLLRATAAAEVKCFVCGTSDHHTWIDIACADKIEQKAITKATAAADGRPRGNCLSEACREWRDIQREKLAAADGRVKELEARVNDAEANVKSCHDSLKLANKHLHQATARVEAMREKCAEVAETSLKMCSTLGYCRMPLKLAAAIRAVEVGQMPEGVNPGDWAALNEPTDD